MVIRIVRCGQLRFDQLMLLHLATNEHKHGTMKEHTISGLSCDYSAMHDINTTATLQQPRENEKLENQ